MLANTIMNMESRRETVDKEWLREVSKYFGFPMIAAFNFIKCKLFVCYHLYCLTTVLAGNFHES